jgi:hypothetical protein
MKIIEKAKGLIKQHSLIHQFSQDPLSTWGVKKALARAAKDVRVRKEKTCSIKRAKFWIILS